SGDRCGCGVVARHGQDGRCRAAGRTHRGGAAVPGPGGMSTPLWVPIERMPGCDDIEVPHYRSDGAAGMDLPAAVTDDVIIEAGQRALIPTGIRMALPTGMEGQIRPRSGLA